MPIFIQDKLLAIITSGQILIENRMWIYFCRKQKYSFNEDEYISARKSKSRYKGRPVSYNIIFGSNNIVYIRIGIQRIKNQARIKKLEYEINERIKQKQNYKTAMKGIKAFCL